MYVLRNNLRCGMDAEDRYWRFGWGASYHGIHPLYERADRFHSDACAFS